MIKRVCLVALGLVGCVADGLELTREKAAIDFDCSAAELQVTQENDVSSARDGAVFRARGCGKHARYLRQNDAVVLNSAIEGGEAPAASSASGAVSAAPSRPAELDTLGQQRVDIARKRVEILRVAFQRGTVSSNDLDEALRDVAFAARDSGLRGDALLKPLMEYRDAMVKMRDLAKSRYDSGAITEADLQRALGQLLEAEFWLAEAKAQR